MSTIIGIRSCTNGSGCVVKQWRRQRTNGQIDIRPRRDLARRTVRPRSRPIGVSIVPPSVRTPVTRPPCSSSPRAAALEIERAPRRRAVRRSACVISCGLPRPSRGQNVAPSTSLDVELGHDPRAPPRSSASTLEAEATLHLGLRLERASTARYRRTAGTDSRPGSTPARSPSPRRSARSATIASIESWTLIGVEN